MIPNLCRINPLNRVLRPVSSEAFQHPAPQLAEDLSGLSDPVSAGWLQVCNHQFHNLCLQRWGDTSCPVCRYVANSEASTSHCEECNSSQVSHLPNSGRLSHTGHCSRFLDCLLVATLSCSSLWPCTRCWPAFHLCHPVISKPAGAPPPAPPASAAAHFPSTPSAFPPPPFPPGPSTRGTPPPSPSHTDRRQLHQATPSSPVHPQSRSWAQGRVDPPDLRPLHAKP